MGDIDASGLPELDGIKVVSFDLYDTLALRPFFKPTDLFLYVEQLTGVKGFRDSRVSAESRARKSIEGEVTLDEIYSLLPADLSGLKELEMRLESQLIFLNPGIVPILESIGDRLIIVVTDMYLPRHVIESIIERLGLEPFEIYISSELRKSKHMGTMFDHILQDLHVSAEEMIHIGDNRRSDVIMPRSKGIHTMHVERPMNAYMKRNNRMLRHYYDGSLGRSVVLGMDLLIDLGVVDAPKDGWGGLGTRIGGPLIYGYVDHVIPRLKGKPVFIARDGYSMKRVYEVLNPDGEEASYLNAQRLFHEILFNETLPEGPVTVPSRMQSWYQHNKMVNAIKGILSFHGIPMPEDESEMVDVYNSNLDVIHERRDGLLEEYSEYTCRMCGDGDVDIIDCTTEKYTSKRLVEKVLCREIYSHFFVVLGNVGKNTDAYGVINGLVLSLTKVDVPEFLMSAPEPPVVGFRDGEAVNDPNPSESEKRRIDLYRQISDGEVAYAKAVKSVFTHEMPHLSYDDVVNWSMASAKVGSPFRELFQQVSWSSNTRHDDSHPLVFGPESLIHTLKKTADTIVKKLNR